MANHSPSRDDRAWKIFVALTAANPDGQPASLARQSYQFADAFSIVRSEEERELKAPPTTLKGPPAYERDAPDASP
jgi:hypothetical protein